MYKRSGNTARIPAKRMRSRQALARRFLDLNRKLDAVNLRHDGSTLPYGRRDTLD